MVTIVCTTVAPLAWWGKATDTLLGGAWCDTRSRSWLDRRSHRECDNHRRGHGSLRPL